MMPAAKHFDPVLGIDIHIVQPPGPVPPVPIPHPFIGMVIDPMDYAPIIGATVMVGGIPRAQAGTAGKNIPSHIPIGGVFVKPPANECEIFMGSSTVSVDGDAFSYLALPVLSCHDVGMPPPPRPKKKSKTKSLVLPTCVVLCIPSGVFVGGAPTISLMALGMRAGMAAAGALFKKAKKAVKGRKGKAKGAKGKKGKKGKSKDNSPCGTDAHPVDVVTGACVDEIVDYDPPGGCPFRWVRWYDSSECYRYGPMGRGFRHPYEVRLERRPDGLRFVDEVGETVDFPHPGEPGQPVTGGGYLLRQLDTNAFEILEPRNRFLRFRFFDPGRPAPLFEIQQGSHKLRLGHDGDGHLTWARDSEGRLYRIEYDEAWRIKAIHQLTSESPHQVLHTLLHFRYDTDGCLVATIDAFGKNSTYEYDRLRLTSLQDRRGYRFHYVYDDEGRVVHTKGEDGLWEARLEYTPEARMTVVRYADGGEWVKLYDEQGMVTDVIHPDGGLLARRIDENGRITEELNPAGNTTEFIYDTFGAQEGRRDHLGRFLGPVWEEPLPPDFDAFRPPQSAAQWEFGALLTPEHPQAGVLTSRALAEVPDEARVALGLNPEPTGRTSIREVLDVCGRVTSREYPDSSRESWRYDPEGNWIEFVDRDGSAYQRTYSSWNLLESETDPLGATTRYGHSLRGEITRFVDPGGTVTEYRRDAKERLVEIQRHGSLKESYSWDQTDSLLEKRGPEGEVLLHSTIGKNGLIASQVLSSGDTHSFEYSDSGRPVTATTEGSGLTLAWDEAGRRLEDKWNGKGVIQTFGPEGLYEATVLDRFVTRYVYRSRWDFEIIDPTGSAHRLRVHPLGLSIRDLSSGRTEVSRFGERGRCDGKLLLDPGRGLYWTRRFEYSPGGNLREARDNHRGSTRYEYDAAHRVIAQHLPDGTERRITYDPAGNILGKLDLEDVRIDTGNRIGTANGDSFEYDSRNHLSVRKSARGSTRFRYDSADMLVRVDAPEGVWEAGYDPFGRRLWKEWKGGRVEFFWNGDQLVAERWSDGGLRVYIYPDHEALVPFLFLDYAESDKDPKEGKKRFLFANQIGAPVRIEDDHGGVLWTAGYGAYGEIEIDPGSRIEFNLRFPGHYHDVETGLHYNRYRYYSPELGRYLQSDPAGAAGGINLYAYPANPVVHVDVLGLTCKDSVKGNGKGKAEGPPHKDARAIHQDVKGISASVGMDPKHVKKLQERAARRGERIIVRGSNPESLKWHKGKFDNKPCVAKPVDCKLKTAKPPDPHAGLVKKQGPDDVAPDGYRFDEDGVLRKQPGDNAVHGDYDLQHVSKGDGTKVDTNDPHFQRELNKEVCPEHQQFKHGANDDYKPNRDADGNLQTQDDGWSPDLGGGETPGRAPDPDESYLVVEPNGTAKQVDGTDNLKQYYDDNNMEWPYD